MARISLSQSVYEKVRLKLLRGNYGPGSRLSEVGLAAEIRVSRTPVREAMSRLESEGLLTRTPGLGSFVCKFNRREIEELYDLRAMLEGYAAGLAAKRIRPHQIAELETLCANQWKIIKDLQTRKAETISPEQGKDFALQDIVFHSLIVEASGSSLVEKAVSDFRIMSHIVRRTVDKDVIPVLSGTYRDHLRVVKALRAGDAESARRRIQEHILAAKEAACAVAGEDGEEMELPEGLQRLVGRM